jgi:hypothetical protein
MYQSGHYSDATNYSLARGSFSKFCDESRIFWDKRTQLPAETLSNISVAILCDISASILCDLSEKQKRQPKLPFEFTISIRLN